jgi:hypothetical protein
MFTVTLQLRLRIQLSSILYAKTLVRKEVVSSTGIASESQSEDAGAENKAPDGLSTKAQVMTLMTTDVDRVGEFSVRLYELIGLYCSICSETVRLSLTMCFRCSSGNYNRRGLPVSAPWRLCFHRHRRQLHFHTIESFCW